MGLRSLPTLLLQTLDLVTQLRPRVLNIGANLSLTEGPASGEATLAATGGGSSNTMSVHNIDPGTLVRGTCVAFNYSATAGVPDAYPMDSDSAATFFGIVTADIAAGAVGTIQVSGIFENFDTSGFSANDLLAVDHTGQLTNLNTPTIGALYHQIGVVLTINATTGSMLILATPTLGDIPQRHFHFGLDQGGPLIYFHVYEGTPPANPPAGQQALYIDPTGHHLKRMDSAGTIVDIG